jgi:Arylsulfotransferase (ASST)
LGAPTAAPALTVSPLAGTPDASPHTQVSFLGAPSAQIAAVSVVGSRSGHHPGRLEAYASAPGASFLPTRPFLPGERVAVSALIGPQRRRVSWAFTVARQLSNSLTAAAVSPPPGPGPRPGTVQSFVSEPALQPPSLWVTASSPAVAPGYLFLTPSHGYGQTGPMIVDNRGQLVWFQAAPRGTVAMNLQVQDYEGRPVLVWWQGRIVGGVGFGTDQIYGSNYQPIAQIAAGNGYEADLHAVRITPAGSAYITAYSHVRADLSSAGGARNGILRDAILQEIDVKTGLVMFEWHAYGHVPLSDSYERPGPAQQPWDFFHINSISPDPWGDGNLLISARNTWTVYEIDHHSGAVLWRLGGKRSSFRMGAGTGTAWQHDARWQPDHTITIFDNGAVPKAHSQSRVIRERIDWPRHTVTLLARYVHSPALLAGSQGDYELLPNGDAFVGWGEEPYLTEFGARGQIVFDAHAAAQSYRAYRFPWSGTPATAPAIAVKAIAGGAVTVYASWNGATGVAAWKVLVGPSSTGPFSPIATVADGGFETAVTVPRSGSYFAAQAIDSSGSTLATSAAVQP